MLKVAQAEFRAELSAPEPMPLTTGVYGVRTGVGKQQTAIRFTLGQPRDRSMPSATR